MYDEMAKNCLDFIHNLENQLDAEELSVFFKTLDKIDAALNKQSIQYENWDDLDEDES